MGAQKISSILKYPVERYRIHTDKHLKCRILYLCQNKTSTFCEVVSVNKVCILFRTHCTLTCEAIRTFLVVAGEDIKRDRVAILNSFKSQTKMSPLTYE